jgi:hypothetical protein
MSIGEKLDIGAIAKGIELFVLIDIKWYNLHKETKELPDIGDR